MHMGEFSEGVWTNIPPDFRFDGKALNVTTGDQTDFWRGTHYGFFRDNGHFLGLPAPASFTATLKFEADYQELYDQAGLMLRLDERNWIKMGVEHSDGVTNFSIVITRDWSDWSVIAQPLVHGQQTVRLTRQESAVIAHFKNAEGHWQLMRVANFPTGPAMLGPMACSPSRAGLKTMFTELNIGSVIENPLHG